MSKFYQKKKTSQVLVGKQQKRNLILATSPLTPTSKITPTGRITLRLCKQGQGILLKIINRHIDNMQNRKYTVPLYLYLICKPYLMYLPDW